MQGLFYVVLVQVEVVGQLPWLGITLAHGLADFLGWQAAAERIGIGAVLQGLIPVKKTEKVCFLISGGNVALEQLKILEEVTL